MKQKFLLNTSLVLVIALVVSAFSLAAFSTALAHKIPVNGGPELAGYHQSEQHSDAALSASSAVREYTYYFKTMPVSGINIPATGAKTASMTGYYFSEKHTGLANFFHFSSPGR